MAHSEWSGQEGESTGHARELVAIENGKRLAYDEILQMGSILPFAICTSRT
jgi:hypothetical protein